MAESDIRNQCLGKQTILVDDVATFVKIAVCNLGEFRSVSDNTLYGTKCIQGGNTVYGDHACLHLI